MKTYSEISIKFSKRLTRYNSAKKLYKERLEKLEANYPHWTDDLLKPLWKEVMKQLPEVKFERGEKFTPMGLCSRVSLFPDYKGKTLMVCFIPGNLEKGELLFETDEVIENFPKGSIGYMNGFGKASLPVESVEQIVNFLKSQIEKE